MRCIKVRDGFLQTFPYRVKLFTGLLAVSFIIMNINVFAQSAEVPDTLHQTSEVSETSEVSAPTSEVSETSEVLPDTKVKIYTFSLEKEIFPAAWRLVKKAVEEAEAMQADYIIMRLNTYGGAVDIADSIRTKLLKTKPITVVLIDHNAASAGALISIACDSIYMTKGASIGAATVVGGTGEQMPDKYQSYMRSTMRATAETQGRDPQIAEAMVDDRSVIPGVIDSGYTLTLTTTEAIKNGFCEGEAESIEDVIQLLGIKDYELVQHKESSLDGIIAFLLNPAVSGILMLLIIGGLYFELQTPGVGFPLVAAIVAAVLYFAPLYLEGLAENWEILVFIAGLALLAVEIFVIPGFGIAGIAGIALIVTGLTLSLIRNVVFDFSLTGFDEVAIALFRVVLSLLAGVVLALLFGEKVLFQGTLFRRLALQNTQQSSEGYVSRDQTMAPLIGKTGTAITDLRPAGTVEIDNERYDVISDGEHIPKSTTVKVVRVQGNYLVVIKSAV